jgi:hypothetical protein
MSKCYVLNSINKVTNAIKADEDFCKTNGLKCVMTTKEANIGDYYRNGKFVSKIKDMPLNTNLLIPLTEKEIEELLLEASNQ